MQSSKRIYSPQRIKSEKGSSAHSPHITEQTSPPNSSKRSRQKAIEEEDEEGEEEEEDEGDELGYEEENYEKVDLYDRPNQRARLETSGTQNIVTLNGKTPDERLQKARLTRECLLLIEAEKEKRDAETPQDIPVQMMPASFRVRKWKRAAEPFHRPGLPPYPGEYPMVLPTWIPIPVRTEKGVSSESNNLQKAYKLMLLEKKRVLLSSGSGTTRTRNRQNMSQVSSSNNTQSQQIPETEASSVSVVPPTLQIPESKASVPPTSNQTYQQLMKSMIVENIISDEEDKVDKAIGKEKKVKENDDLDELEEEEFGEKKKEKERDELDELDIDDDDDENDDNDDSNNDDNSDDDSDEKVKRRRSR